ncbi:hypothetical protein GQ44DRAFT_824927 [Phaeosphaeriaceae sp. PMI808]|nr:hypothetical protein GQ44DRAFT_824927 [Phaeosphaeriaceae sp. PMI808]
MALSPSNIGLVEDVKRIVLEYISLPSDTKALCLVSKNWSLVATQHLYADIVIDTNHFHGQLETLEASLRCGASKHLQHTRSFSIYDSLGAWEHSGWTGLVSDNQKAATQETILRLLRMLHDNRLHTFRYISNDPFDATCIEYLHRHQQLIQNLHVTQCDPLLLVNHSRRSITANFWTSDQLNCALIKFVKLLPPLESLFMGNQFGWNAKNEKYWAANPTDLLAGTKIRATELAISGCMSQSFGSLMDHIFDFSLVTNLSLYDFNLSLLMDHIAGLKTLCHMTHFQCRSIDAISTEMENPRSLNILHNLLDQNKCLRHVRLSIRELARLLTRPSEDRSLGNTTVVPQFLLPLRQRLLSLVWHSPSSTYYSDKMRALRGCVTSESFQGICHNFPHLQQLGLRAQEEPFIQEAVPTTWKKHLLTYFEPLSMLQDLRILQLYQEAYRPVHKGKSLRGETRITSEVQGFVTSLFQWADIHCPKLNIIIWGAHNEIVPPYLEADVDYGILEHSPQLFFIKQENPGNIGQVYASITTRRRLIDDFSELGLLTWDVGFIALHQHIVRW